MKKRTRRKRRNNILFVTVATAITLMFVLPATTLVYGAAPVTADAGVYRYNPEGKPNPFKPFIEIVNKKNEAGQEQKAGMQKETVFLSPLQKVSTELFRLTGIVLTENRKVAIVEAPDGKRYILRIGTPIGINGGRVTKILADRVAVLEKPQDFEGNTQQERVILTLKRNGGKP